MPSNRHLEAILKREITSAFKSMFGKGPDKTTISIFDNVIFCKIEGILTALEQNLIQTEEGINLVKKIREQIDVEMRPEYIRTLEAIMDDQVESIEYSIINERQAIYLFIVMKNNIVRHN